MNMNELTLKEYVTKQATIIKKHLKSEKPLTIEITDNVCALDFKKYAKEESWPVDNVFEITFADKKNVLVSLHDFIKYNLQYTDLALEIEEKFAEQIDELRMLQEEALDKMQEEYKS